MTTPTNRPLRIAVVAGETSGDRLGAGLLQALAAKNPTLQVEGIGGPRMSAAGCRTLYPLERLSVMGLFEVLGRYPEILRLRARLARRLIADRPDVFIGIDAPDFNLPLAGRLHQASIPTVHYVSPQVWAWRSYRIRGIARAVDRMLTLFPFEAAFYERYQVPVRFVGHPFADQIPDHVDRQAARNALGLATEGELVALLPGSRMQEVRRLAESMILTARWLVVRRPGLRFVVAVADSSTKGPVTAALKRDGQGLPVTLWEGDARTAMTAANVVLVASGTATLEALLLKRPMVITYRTGALTYRLVKAMVTVSHVGLPNLLAGRSLVPELLQDEATPEKLGQAVLEMLQRPNWQAQLQKEFQRIHETLRKDADGSAATAVLELVQERSAHRVAS